MKKLSFDSKILKRHPCFSADAHNKFGRIHLPVAPLCNIKCLYCDRKYGCVNESRPGVSSRVLSLRKLFSELELLWTEGKTFL